MADAPVKGVVCLLIGPNGAIWGQGVDFDIVSGAPAGFGLAEVQERRARAAMRRNFADNAISAAVAKLLTPYDIDRICDRLKEEFKVHTIKIGHQASWPIWATSKAGRVGPIRSNRRSSGCSRPSASRSIAIILRG